MLILYKMTDILRMKSSPIPTEPQHVIHLYPVYCLETVLEVWLTLNPPLLSKMCKMLQNLSGPFFGFTAEGPSLLHHPQYHHQQRMTGKIVTIWTQCVQNLNKSSFFFQNWFCSSKLKY